MADNYTIRENINRFLFELFKDDEFEVRMEKAIAFPSLGKMFIKNISQTYDDIREMKAKKECCLGMLLERQV